VATPRSSAASVREQKLARVIDREVAPIWHDRFARLLLRELPANTGTFALDIHSGPGHTTAELLQRLDESSRVVALGRDPWLMQVSKMRVRPEWKRRVYFKAGDMDDVPGMADATYDLAIANLVLGEQVVDWKAALAELVRVTKPGGQVLATLPMHGTWEEVEDLFEELLRDEGMRREMVTLQQLRRRRPKPSQLVAGLRELGFAEDDVVLEHERFDMLFRSGREFLFAPVIEHGPLRLWKAIIGRAEKPQALFWRFKEAIDTYYAGHVLAVSVVAGLIRVRVPGGETKGSYAAEYWGRYPSLARLWGAPGAPAKAADEDFDLDLDIDVDEAEPAAAESGAAAIALGGDSGSGFTDHEVSGLSVLPAVEDAALGDDLFAGLLEDLDAEAAAAAEVVAEDAAAQADLQSPAKTGRAATLGALEDSSGLRSLPRKPGESGVSPLPSGLPRKPGESGVSPLPSGLPRKPGC
jgi:ubiquinone/menaquinone biosynthesis C-methylase UbiE